MSPGPVLALVPARGGSKGIPRKNVRSLAGRPLLAYTAEAARGSGVVDRLVLSTEDDEIREVGVGCGMEAPFVRPAALAQDDSPMLAVVEHALGALGDAGWIPEIVVLLQPTSPLRRPAHVAHVVRALQESDADSVVTVVELPRHYSPDYVMRIDDGYLANFLPEGARIARRQDARPAFVRDGTAYAFRTRTLREQGSIYGRRCRPYLIPAAESLTVDTLDDWAEAERRLATPDPATPDSRLPTPDLATPDGRPPTPDPR
jgi:CMP-N,N'-diacetyllegionaminic acid synthase